MANYPTDTYTNLKSRFKALAGISELETTDSEFLRQLTNKRIRMGYERYPWPNHTIIGETVTSAERPTANQIVTYGSAKGLNNNADVVFKIHAADPTSSRYPEEYQFVTHADSSGNPIVELIEPTTITSNVYVTYRTALEDVVEDDSGYSTGFFGDAAGDNPNIPYQFFEYAVYGSYADFLRGDGQTDKAIAEDQNAELHLRQEIDKVKNQNRQFRHDLLQYRPVTQFRRHQSQAGGAPVNAEASSALGNTTT